MTGTSSLVILLNNKYIIKHNDVNILRSEVSFSELVHMATLQHMEYYDKNFSYVVYDFVPGDVMHIVDDVDDLISNITNIVSSYPSYAGPEFGYLHSPSASWGEFLKSRVHNASMTLSDSFNYLSEVYEALEELEKYPFEKKLIHGDFGTHNFIKQNGKFVSAIDPLPIAGDALYDLIFALLSNIDILPHLSLEYISEISDEPLEKVRAMLTVVLFCRFSTCLAYHREDIDKYVDFWYKIV